MDPTDLINYQNAIKSIESSGGNYGLTGPVTRSGDRAYGAYQVMGNNIPDWTQKHYGQALTPQQFLQNKEAQDAVFNGEFGGYVGKYGNPQDAASAWFTGRPLAQGGKSSDGYITGNQYVDRFNKALGQPAQANGSDDGATIPATATPTSGNLTFGNDDSTGKQDNRFGLGDLFGASDETKAKMHGIGARLVRAAAALSAGVNPSQSSQLNALGKSLEDGNKSDFQYMMGPNGQLVKVNKDTGEVSFATLPGGGKGNFGVVMGKDPTTGNPMPIGKINHNTGEYSPFQPANNAPQGPQVGGDPNLEGQDRLNSMSPEDQRAVQAILDGRDPRILSSLSIRNNPKLTKYIEAAQAVKPGFDFNTAKGLATFRVEEAKSGPSSFGGLNRRQKTAMDLLDKTIDQYGDLGNTTSALGSTASKAENYLTSGGVDQAAKREHLAVLAKNAATDINALQVLGRGTGSERESLEEGLNKPYASPQEQAAVIQGHLDALKSARDAAFEQKRAQVGEEVLKNDPDYIAATNKVEQMQTKLDKLKKGDFSYVPGGLKKATPAATAAPTLDHAAIDAELKRRGL